ncbi:MAG TPA: TIGR03435 family protein [Candidatus Acidoferrales bacterium]
MHKLSQITAVRRRLFLVIAALATLTIPTAFNPLHATPTEINSLRQLASASLPDFKYDVASIKPSPPPTGGGMMVGMRETPDGLVATNVPLLFLVQSAYTVDRPQISGAPSWLNSDRYDVDARMDSSVVDALEKLTVDERKVARRKMLQALLADRMKLVVHHDSKEVTIFSLVIAKNGPKLQESKPAVAPANGTGGSAGGRGSGLGMSMGSEEGMTTATFHDSPISYVASWLQANLRTPVLDKTELTGLYDFKLKWMPERNRSAVPSSDAPNGQPAVATSDPTGPTLMDAIQDQLGLKLEPGKGPVEVIVIDHIEKPSGN